MGEVRKAGGFRTSGGRAAPSISNSEAQARVTSAAILEIQIASEGTPSIMTTSAGVVAVREMFERPRRTDLAFLRQARCVDVTV